MSSADDVEQQGLEAGSERVVVSRRELARERQREAARKARQEAYRRAKARRDQDPRYLAMKEAAKLRRRELYREVKARRKEAELLAKASEKASRAAAKRPAANRPGANGSAADGSAANRAAAERAGQEPLSRERQLAELRQKLALALSGAVADEHAVANDH